MKWEKSPPELVEKFNTFVPEKADVEKRKMFGYPCSFINGNMFMGLYEKNMFLRLSEKDREEFLKLDRAGPFEPVTGRPMKQYVVIPPWLIEDKKELSLWIERSYEYASNLPPKKKRKKKS